MTSSNMIKYIMFIMIFVQIGHSQKSFYAGQQPWYPKVLAKYRTTTPTATPESLVNRVGDNTVSSSPDSSSQIPPVEEYESNNDWYIQRISSLPEDKQPFWYKNRQAISEAINQRVDGGAGQRPQNNRVRSPFAGQSS